MVKSCYIHIPFCETICSYCDFCKVFYKEQLVDDYLTALEKEIKETYQNEVLHTIYIGGGTPSSLSFKQLERLFDILKVLKKDNNIEFTIEGNINSTTKEKLELYKKVGINRLSFGIESIDPQNLEFLNRKESKELGFSNINVDLIYALPKEDLSILQKDLDFLFSLNIEHISTYSLMIEDHTLLKIQNQEPISSDLDFKMYETITKEMKKHSYDHYEISNFSKKGYESKHNLCYWNNEEYYGFGLGASSYQNSTRIENTRSLTDYIKGNRIKNKEELTEEDKIEYEVLLNLRKKDGISYDTFKKKYHINFKEKYHIQDLITNHFLEEDENHLWIPEEKWYVSNEIIVQILEREVYE